MFGRFAGSPSDAELAQFFFLDNADRALVDRRRGAGNRLGFALQLCTARFLGTFVAVPGEVPDNAIGFVARQLDVGTGVLAGYARRPKTALEHQWQIRREVGYTDFGGADVALREFMLARAWTRRERPSELFDHAVVWLRDAKVPLPGLSVLTRLVSEVRADADTRMYDTIADQVAAELRATLDRLLVVDDDARVSPLQQLRRVPTVASGRQLVRALRRVEEVRAVGALVVDVSAIPDARVEALARHGLATDVASLRRLPTRRRIATLVAVVQSLAVTAVDDAVDVFSVLMATKLIRPAERASNKQRLRVWNDLADASSTLAATGRVVLELMADTNDPVDPLDEALAWRRLMSTIQEDKLASAVGVAIDVVPPGERDRHAGARKELLAKYGTVAQFLDLFAATIPFAATAAGTQILFALQNLGPSIADGQLKRSDVIESVVTGSWRPLVFGSFSKDLDAKAYALCVLEAVHGGLRRRDIYVRGSRRWGDPRARLIGGGVWDHSKRELLTALRLTENPDRQIADLASRLDAGYLQLAAQLDTDANDAGASIETDTDGRGRLKVDQLAAVPEPDSLIELRPLVAAMMPRVDLPELLMDVHAMTGCFDEFSHYALADRTAGTRMEDLAISLAAVFVAEGCNLGFTPVIKAGHPHPQPALSRQPELHPRRNPLRSERSTHRRPSRHSHRTSLGRGPRRISRRTPLRGPRSNP